MITDFLAKLGSNGGSLDFFGKDIVTGRLKRFFTFG